MGDIQELKLILREEYAPFFTEEELAYYYNKNSDDFNKAVYECAMIKAQNCTVNLGSGLSFTDDPNVYLRIAKMHRPNASRCL